MSFRILYNIYDRFLLEFKESEEPNSKEEI